MAVGEPDAADGVVDAVGDDEVDADPVGDLGLEHVHPLRLAERGVARAAVDQAPPARADAAALGDEVVLEQHELVVRGVRTNHPPPGRAATLPGNRSAVAGGAARRTGRRRVERARGVVLGDQLVSSTSRPCA